MIWRQALLTFTITVASSSACRSQEGSLLATPYAYCAGLHFWLETSLDSKKLNDAESRKTVSGYMDKRRHLKVLSNARETDPDLSLVDREEASLRLMVLSERDIEERWANGCNDTYSCRITASQLVGELQFCEELLRKSGYYK